MKKFRIAAGDLTWGAKFSETMCGALWMPTSDELKTKRALFERIGWDLAERDDHAVAAAVAAREEIDIVHNLDQAGLLDAFMAYLREIGFLAFLESFTP